MVKHPWDKLNQVAHNTLNSLENETIRHKWEKSLPSSFGPRPTMLVFTGAWNSGKSTIINGLIGRPNLLPTGPIPVTSLITEISWASKESFQVNYGDQKTTYTSVDEFHESLGTSDVQKNDYQCFAELSLPSMPFQNAVMVDTPGTRAPLKSHEVVTNAYMPRADAVVYVMQASFAGQGDDLRRLKRISNRMRPKDIFLVFNHSINLLPEERKDLERFVNNQLNLGEPFASVHFTEATLFALNETGEKEVSEEISGLKKLKEDLAEFLFLHGEQAAWNMDIKRIISLANRQKVHWQNELVNLKKTELQLDTDQQKNAQELEIFRTNMHREVDKVGARLKVVGTEVRKNLQSCFQNLRSVADEIACNLEDPFSEAERSNLVEYIITEIDQIISQLLNLSIQSLKAEILKIPEQIHNPQLASKDIVLPWIEKTDLEAIIGNQIEEISDMIDTIKPYLDTIGDKRIEKMAGEAKRKIDEAVTLLNKFGFILKMITDKMDKEDLRVSIRSSVSERLFQIWQELDEEIVAWWSKIVAGMLEEIEKEFEKSSSEELDSILKAKKKYKEGEKSVEKRRNDLIGFLDILNENVISIEGLQYEH